MTHIFIPAVVSRSGLVSRPRVSEEPVRSLHVQSVIGIETSAAIVVLFKIGVDHGHTRACVANFVLGYRNFDRDTPATTAGAQGTNSKIVGIQRTYIDHEKDDARQFALARYRLRTGFVNGAHVYPFSDGTIYQVYTAPGLVTDIMLQPGETLVAVASGDTARWVIGDTTSGSDDGKQTHVLVKPVSAGLLTNLVITTDRRAYHLRLASTPATALSSLRWTYPQDELLALRRKAEAAQAAAPVATGLAIDQLHFNYAISGDRPPWRPLRVFDDGTRTYVEFPASLANGDAPPLFVVGPDLPGMVTAQVTQNVFDTVTGTILLVPQGARLIGKYDSVVAFGQRRALVIWQRLILPDGSSVRLDNMPATDPAGYAGLADRVDFHTWTLLKGVAIATMLGVGSELSISGGSDLVQAIRQSAQLNAARAGDQITQRNLDVQPTVTIRPGAPVRVLVTRDLILAPYLKRTS